MILLPVQKHNFFISYNIEEAKLKLGELVNQERPLFKRMYANDILSNKQFCGKIIGDYFKISEVIFHGDPSLPVIAGNIKNHDDYSVIKITMRLSYFVVLFMIIWISIGVAMCIYTKTFVPLIALIPSYLLLTISFNKKAKKNIKIIKELMVG